MDDHIIENFAAGPIVSQDCMEAGSEVVSAGEGEIAVENGIIGGV